MVSNKVETSKRLQDQSSIRPDITDRTGNAYGAGNELGHQSL